MSSWTKIEYYDDFDGELIEEGKAETIRLMLDGTSYEVDLSQGNAAELRASVAPFIASARRTTGRRAPSTRSSADAAARRKELDAVRDFGRRNGHKVSSTGKIAQSVWDAYNEAHGV